jgi:hypothetical protein
MLLMGWTNAVSGSQKHRNWNWGIFVKLTRAHLRQSPKFARVCLVLLVLLTLAWGCQTERATPTPTQNDRSLAGDMKAWFEATDYDASGFSSLEEALEGIYQDDGYTVSLYRELGSLLDDTDATPAAYDSTLRMCQEWFEMIDYEASGYETLEDSIADIYQDDGATLELYKRLVKRNAEGG